MRGLVDELLELSDPEVDQRIIKSFKMKDTLCPSIFDKNENGSYEIKKEIRDKLIEISDDFITFWGVDFFIHDIILIGSLANYNWSEYSDVDLHIIVDMSELGDSEALTKIVKEFFDAKKRVWNEFHDVKIKNFDVELYVQDVDDEYVSSGVYSILNNEWVAEPSQNPENIDTQKILDKGEYFAKQIDSLIDGYNNNKDVSAGETALRDKLKKFRKSGLDSGGEYSYENLTFKLLRRNGYIQKIMDMKRKLYDKQFK
jgi:predicted nucleotidyltransferase